MDKTKEAAKSHKTIQVKGMNGLSLNYIQRFFGHAGPVQEVKKIQDLVLVSFKNQASVNKALRFSGRIIDKQPIKIRVSFLYQSMQSRLEEVKPWEIKQQASRTQQIMNQIIKNKSFDVPFFWASALKLINKIAQRKKRWLIHEIFFIKLSQVIHFHAFMTNIRSTYRQVSLKQLLLSQGKGAHKISDGLDKIEKLQILSIIPNDLSDEAGFQTVMQPLDLRLKQKFRQILRPVQGDRLYLLYSLFNTYSLHIPRGQPIFSTENNLYLQNQKQFFSVSKEIVTKNRAKICLREGSCGNRRSQYRNIDNQHPNKQIQILSDCSTQNLFEDTTYDIFRDDFDGNISNNCAADFFYMQRFYFAPNYIIMRCYQMGKLYSIRLDFELRLLNCSNEKIYAQSFCSFLIPDSENKFINIGEIALKRHNIVISDFENIQKVCYMIENYVKNLMQVNSKQQQQTKQKLIVIIFFTNPTAQRQQMVRRMCVQTNKNALIQNLSTFYIIKIQDADKFQKYKCSNFIEEYVDEQKGGTFNLEIAKAHAKLLIEQHPHKFQTVANAEQFVTQQIWRLEQQKTKRAAKNRIKMQLQLARSE